MSQIATILILISGSRKYFEYLNQTGAGVSLQELPLIRHGSRLAQWLVILTYLLLISLIIIYDLPFKSERSEEAALITAIVITALTALHLGVFLLLKFSKIEVHHDRVIVKYAGGKEIDPLKPLEKVKEYGKGGLKCKYIWASSFQIPTKSIISIGSGPAFTMQLKTSFQSNPIMVPIWFQDMPVVLKAIKQLSRADV